VLRTHDRGLAGEPDRVSGGHNGHRESLPRRVAIAHRHGDGAAIADPDPNAVPGDRYADPVSLAEPDALAGAHSGGVARCHAGSLCHPRSNRVALGKRHADAAGRVHDGSGVTDRQRAAAGRRERASRQRHQW
jgi:hypothetical protein